MDWPTITENSQQAILRAEDLARARGGTLVGTEHLLAAILDDSGSVAVQILQELGMDVKTIRVEVADAIAHASRGVGEEANLTQTGHRAIDFAYRESREGGPHRLRTGHLLLGLIHEENGTAAAILARHGVNLERARRALRRALARRRTEVAAAAAPDGRGDEPSPEDGTS